LTIELYKAGHNAHWSQAAGTCPGSNRLGGPNDYIHRVVLNARVDLPSFRTGPERGQRRSIPGDQVATHSTDPFNLPEVDAATACEHNIGRWLRAPTASRIE